MPINEVDACTPPTLTVVFAGAGSSFGGVLVAGEPAQALLHLIEADAGEEAEAAQVNAKDRHRETRQEPRATEQRPVAAERGETAEALRAREELAGPCDLMEVRLEEQLEVQLGRQTQQRAQNVGQPRIPAVPDDAQVDHPAIASDSCSARTRSAMPRRSRRRTTARSPPSRPPRRGG